MANVKTLFTAAIFSLVFQSAIAFADIHKCTMADGRITYSDMPCPTDVTKTDLIQGPAIQKSTVTPRSLPTKLPAPRTIDFTGSPQTDFLKASALLDNIRVMGRDCEWALKVDKSKLSACTEFMTKLQTGGEYAQIGTQVSKLMENRATAEPFMGELRTINRHMQDIVRYKEFMLANLGVTSK